MKIFVHIVTWNSSDASLERTVSSVLEQNRSKFQVEVEITDNGSRDTTPEILREISRRFPETRIFLNAVNLGFCGAHNQGIARFLQSECELYLALNPDAFLTPGSLGTLAEALNANPKLGSATPKLLRCDQDGVVGNPPRIDAAGMCLEASLRHFDRGSGEIDTGQWEKGESVFGGTGACLLLTRTCIDDCLITECDSTALCKVFPQLKETSAPRAQLFDEAFFAFREDADLAWRMQIRGFECAYVPRAIVYHVRRVTPERRSELSPEINLYGVRNRFLLQLNNLCPPIPWKVFVRGIFLRNLVVTVGVLVRERTSLEAFNQVRVLWRRAIEQRRRLQARPGSSFPAGVRWAIKPK